MRRPGARGRASRSRASGKTSCESRATRLDTPGAPTLLGESWSLLCQKTKNSTKKQRVPGSKAHGFGAPTSSRWAAGSGSRLAPGKRGTDSFLSAFGTKLEVQATALGERISTTSALMASTVLQKGAGAASSNGASGELRLNAFAGGALMRPPFACDPNTREALQNEPSVAT